MKFTGIGSYIPEGRLDLTELEKSLGLEAGWIKSRTGMETRPTALPEQATSDLAIAAGRNALEDANLNPSEIGMLIVATSTPDHLLPPVAPLIAHELGLSCGAIDLAGACGGFLYATVLANSYGMIIQKPVMVIAVNVLSRRLNPADSKTLALFADGAGAVVIQPGKIIGHHLGADGKFWKDIYIPAGGSRQPITHAALDAGEQYMRMEKGPDQFRRAVRRMVSVAEKTLQSANMTVEEIDLWIPHQANSRLIKEVGAQLGIPESKTVNVVGLFSNSSAATIPIAMDYARKNNLMKQGDKVLLTAVGAGMVEAGAIVNL